MCKTKKVIILLLLAVVLLVFSVAGCSADTNESESKIDNLHSQLEELNDKSAELDKLNDKVAEMEEQIEQLEKELAELSPGSFYTLQEAYDNGWLSQADLMSIAYYGNGGRELNEEIMSEDYEPAPKTPEVLNNLTELKIKNAAAKEYREQYDKNDAKAEDFRITEYYGTYGDCISVKTRDNYSGLIGIVCTESIAGVYFCYNTGMEIKIWRDTK